jgi:hypothetical protein
MLKPECRPRAYQVAELEHQQVRNGFYTLSDTLKNVWVLKNTEENKSYSSGRMVKPLDSNTNFNIQRDLNAS